MNEPILELSGWPFYVGVRDDAPASGIPASLPFRLGFDDASGLAVQLPNAETSAALTRAYDSGSLLSIPLGEGTFGAARMAKMMAPLRRLLGDPKGKKTFEIGCGTGRPTAELLAAGADAAGCEPGPQAGGENVARAYFSHERFPGPFDAVYSFGVLEHIEDPLAFLRDAIRSLRPGGLFFACLQDAEPFLEAGDPAILLHEHWTYFTGSSAERLLRSAGLSDTGHERLTDVGELAFWGRRGASAGTPTLVSNGERTRVRRYAAAVRRRLEGFRAFAEEAKRDGRTVGLYAGGLPYLWAAGAGLRLFDGDRSKHGKRWFDGAPSIEAPERLLSEPVDDLVVCARSYVRPIVEFLEKELRLPSSTRIHTVDTLPEAVRP